LKTFGQCFFQLGKNRLDSYIFFPLDSCPGGFPELTINAIQRAYLKGYDIDTTA
jgi:hypothetical protein